MKVGDIVKATGGVLLRGDPAREVSPRAFSTDSRTMRRGGIFIALKGPNFDGHDFIAEAFRKGATGVIVSKHIRDTSLREIMQLREKCPGHETPRRKKCPDHETHTCIIKVADTAKAYGAIARYHRMRFDIPLIAVTGSNGKTTTKEMIARILSRRFDVLKNDGTKNNHIGVPETLLALAEGTDVAVLELGMNRLGEIRYLAGIAQPSIGVITNIGPSHLEFLGSLGNVFKAKRELLERLPRGALAVINGDDPFLAKARAERLRLITFGLGPRNDFRATDLRADRRGLAFRVNGRHQFRLNLLGVHNVYNALAAIAISAHFKMGFPAMRAALAPFAGCAMRLTAQGVGDIVFLNDAYNSNPLSMRYALDALSDYETTGRRFIVAGDMLELGDKARPFHAQMGELVARSRVDYLLTIGRLSNEMSRSAIRAGMGPVRVRGCRTHADAARALKALARPRDVVLVKGSRQMEMEKVIERFKELG